MKKVAVTGGIASGKSTACRMLQNLGAYVVSADQITHELLSSDKALKRQVISLLGSEILEGAAIDRTKVAKKVFSSSDLLQKLETLIHPRVERAIKREWQKQKKKGKAPLFVVEIPLLFETQDTTWYDAIITVVASRELCVERFSKNTGYAPEEYERRMSRQKSPEEKIPYSTFVVTNENTQEHLFKEIQNLYTQLTDEGFTKPRK